MCVCVFFFYPIPSPFFSIPFCRAADAEYATKLKALVAGNSNNNNSSSSNGEGKEDGSSSSNEGGVIATEQTGEQEKS